MLVESVAAKQVRVFSTPDWLDRVCGANNWGACIAFDKGGTVTGMMPYCFKRYLGKLVIRMPTLTPFLDVWINYPHGMRSTASQIRFRRKVMKELITGLPATFYFSQQYSYSLTDWLPFYWQGFRQTTMYSYVFPAGKSVDVVWHEMKPETRNMLRRAARELKVVGSPDIDSFYQLNEESYRRKGLVIPYTKSFLLDLFNRFQAIGQAHIYFAEDANGVGCAGILVFSDHATDYYLASGFDKKWAPPGAVQLLLWHAIKSALGRGKSFDFEGSMIPSIAAMFKGFGADQLAYSKIFKGQNRFIQALKILRR